MEYIRITKDNIEEEHICCAISNNKDVQVSSKKAWLSERFNEVLVFLIVSIICAVLNILIDILLIHFYGYIYYVLQEFFI